MKHAHKTLSLLTLFVISLFLIPVLFQQPASAQMDHNYFELSRLAKRTETLTNRMFETARIENTEEPFCFAVAGDPHYGKYDYSADVFEWVLEDVNSKNFAFLIVNGDLVQTGFGGQYRDYFNAINQSDTPVVSVIGNHDVRFGGRSRFENIFGEQTYFDFTVGDYQFIILDSADKSLGSDQLNYLDAQLQEPRINIVITHVPRAELDDANHFTTIINKHPPALIIYSHNHKYYNTVIGETEVIVTDSAGGGEPPESYISFCIDAEKQRRCARGSFASATCDGNQITHKQIFAPPTIV